jgi:hypothetical protein
LTSPTIASFAEQRIRQELAIRLSHGHDAVLRRVPDLYRRIIGEALAAEQGQLGQAAKLRAAQRALDRIADIGVVDFVDSAGRRWNMQSYVEMAVRTAATRAMVDAQTQVYRQRGLNLVRVSDHSGACPVCAPFEGRLLAIDAMPDEDTSPDRNGTRIEVVATIADAIAAGLMHPNCRHTLHAWRPGVSILPTPHPYNPAEFEAQQRLRAMERQVRHWRRRQAAAITPEARDKARAKVAAWQGEIRRHVDATGVRRLRDREQTVRPLPSPTPRRRPPVSDAERIAEEFRQRAEADRQATLDRLAREEAEHQAEEARRRAEEELRRLSEWSTENEHQQIDRAFDVEDHYRDTVKLTETDREAVRAYAGFASDLLNRALRGQREMDPLSQGLHDDLLRAANKYRTTEQITVWRGTGGYQPPPNLPAGHIETDQGWVSASLMKTRAFEGTLLEIVVPPGFPGIVVNGAIDDAPQPEEREFLLPAGTRFGVLRDETRGGRRWLRLIAIAPE